MGLDINLAELTAKRQPIVETAVQEENPLNTALVIGLGKVADKQLVSYEHWHDTGTNVIFADGYSGSVERWGQSWDHSDDVFHIDVEEDKLRKRINEMGGAVDLLLVNNAPQDHLTTALKFSNLAKQIIIQKPQDVNFPLIQTVLSGGDNYASFKRKAMIHDHYRNKGVIPALYKTLKEKMATHGKIKRIMFFITESKSMKEENSRSEALRCGMIQDLGVHMFDIFLEMLMYCDSWQTDPKRDSYAKRIQGTMDLKSVSKAFEINTSFPQTMETFAAIDLEVTEQLKMAVGPDGKDIGDGSPGENKFNVLFVMGKGVHRSQGIGKDVKSIVIEHERKGETIIDLSSLSSQGMDQAFEVNCSHGGLNRPLMLMSKTPPAHATEGIGSFEYPQWQTLNLSYEISKLAQEAIAFKSPYKMEGYPDGRPVSDMLREMATDGRIRSIWNDIKDLGRYALESNRAADFFQ